MSQPGDLHPVSLSDPAADAPTDDDTDSDLERIPRARHARVAVECEYPSRLLDDVDQALPVREMSAQQDVVIAAGQQLDDSRVPVDHDRPAVGAFVDAFHAGDRAL